MNIFRLPDLGEGLAEAELHQWYVKPGDSISEDEPMLAVETAKALVDIPSPQSGLIQTLHAVPGETIAVNAPLVSFKQADHGSVVGQLETAENLQEKRPPIKAMPAVRALAQKYQLDIHQITPTGAQGQLTRNDVETAATQAQQTQTGSEKLHGARRTMALSMHQSQRQVAPATIMHHADIHHWSEDTDITTRLIQAMSAACQAEPTLNAHYHHTSLSRTLLSKVNMGIALDVGENLYMPVIADVARQDQRAIRQQLNDFKQRATRGGFCREDFKAPSIILSNFGSIGGRYATPLVVPPMVGIIGAGRAYDEVIAYQGKPTVHRVLPLSLTIDHRAVTGAEAARFLNHVIAQLEGVKTP